MRPIVMIARVILAVVLAGPISAVLAQETWTLVTPDLARQAVTLESLDEKSVTVGTRDGRRTLTMEQFVQLERVAAPAAGQTGRFTLHLHGGDRIGGEPMGVAGEQLRWNSPAVGEIHVSVRQLAGMVRGAGALPPLEDGRTHDLLKLANGDSVEGTVTNIEAGGITLIVGGEPLTVPLDTVATLQFATPQRAGPIGQRGFRIRLSDGSSFIARGVRLAGDVLELTLSDESQRSLPLGSVVGIEQVNGPIVWLSSLAPAEDRQTSLFDLTWPTRMDRSVTGEPMRYDRVYERGIGVHARSVLVFRLPERFAAFRTQYAIHGTGDLADVTVRILVDGREVHRQENVRVGKVWPPATVELGDAKELTLEVDFGENGDAQDRFNWLEPALLREMPATRPVE